MQQFNILSHKQTKYCRKLACLNNKQAGTLLLCAWYCAVSLMWHILPPNSSSSFEVSTIFGDRNFDDVRVCTKDGQSTLWEFYQYLYCCNHEFHGGIVFHGRKQLLHLWLQPRWVPRGRLGRILWILYNQPVFDAPVWGLCRNFPKLFSSVKTWLIGLPYAGESMMISKPFWYNPGAWRTELLYQYRASALLGWHAIDKNRTPVNVIFYFYVSQLVCVALDKNCLSVLPLSSYVFSTERT